MPGPSKLNQTSNIPRGVPSLSSLIFHANPSTGLGEAAEVQELLALLTGTAPCITFANEAAMLANTILPIGYFAHLSDTDLFYLYEGPDPTDIASYTLVAAPSATHFLGVFASEAALIAAFPTANPGDYALVDTGGVDAQLYVWDDTDSVWVASGITTIIPDASETVKGISEEATQEQVNNGTGTGETGARLFVNPQKLAPFIDIAVTARSIWEYQNLLTTPVPDGKVRFNNNSSLAAVTEMRVAQMSDELTDAGYLFSTLIIGDVIFIQQRNDATKWARFKISSTPVDNGTWWTFGVSLIESSGAFPATNTKVILRFTEAAGGGVQSAFLTESFTGDGVATVFTIPGTAAIQIAAVYVGGQRLKDGTHYTKDNAARTVTISPAVPTGIGIDVEYFSGVSSISSLVEWSESTLGVARIATQTETNAGVDDLRGITPLKLSTWLPSRMATQAEVNTGTNDTKVFTPLKLATWWTYVKTLVQTFSNVITFSDRPIFSTLNNGDFMKVDSVKQLVGYPAATGAEAVAGTDNSKPLTAASLEGKGSVKRYPCAVSAGTMNLDCAGKDIARFENTTTISANFAITVSGNADNEFINLILFITGTIAITLPSSVIMEDIDGRFVNATKVLTLIGATASPFELSFAKISSSRYVLRASYKNYPS